MSAPKSSKSELMSSIHVVLDLLQQRKKRQAPPPVTNSSTLSLDAVEQARYEEASKWEKKLGVYDSRLNSLKAELQAAKAAVLTEKSLRQSIEANFKAFQKRYKVVEGGDRASTSGNDTSDIVAHDQLRDKVQEPELNWQATEKHQREQQQSATSTATGKDYQQLNFLAQKATQDTDQESSGSARDNIANQLQSLQSTLARNDANVAAARSNMSNQLNSMHQHIHDKITHQLQMLQDSLSSNITATDDENDKARRTRDLAAMRKVLAEKVQLARTKDEQLSVDLAHIRDSSRQAQRELVEAQRELKECEQRLETWKTTGTDVVGKRRVEDPDDESSKESDPFKRLRAF